VLKVTHTSKRVATILEHAMNAERKTRDVLVVPGDRFLALM